MKISFWCEFPRQVNWKRVSSFLNSINLKTEIFIAVKSKKEFLSWKNKIKSKSITLVPWPLLPKTHGYWFSGFTSRQDIKKLEEFKGHKFFIDAEPPLPKFKYNLLRFMIYYINLFFHHAKNFYFLKKEVSSLCKRSKILYAEFPFPHKIFKQLGVYINAKNPRFNNNLEKVLGWYTTIFGHTIRRLFKPYLKHKAKQVINLYSPNNPDELYLEEEKPSKFKKVYIFMISLFILIIYMQESHSLFYRRFNEKRKLRRMGKSNQEIY